MISGGVEELLAHPDQQARLSADPAGLMPGAVEEMLRWVSPIKNMARTATRDVELAGAQIREGQELLLLYASANRDEAVFDDPETFDITRSPNPHIAFGFGAHFCLGNQLARLELRVMVERLLARLPDLHLAIGPGRAAAPGGELHLGHRRDAGRVHTVGARGRRPRLMAGPGAGGIDGWSILVTGGGSGIGLATAERLAADGAHVTICGRTEQKLADATARIAAVASDGATVALRRGRRDGRRAKSQPRWRRHARSRVASTGCSPARADRCTSARCSRPTWRQCAPPSTSTSWARSSA